MILLVFLLLISLSFGGWQVKEKTLENGLRVIYKETKGKGIISAVLFFKGGQNGEKRRGETNLLMTLLLKGSKSFPSSYHVSLPFESLGGYIYSSSSDDFSEIGFTTKMEGFEKALEVLRDVVMNPLLREEDIDREKTNVIMAIRSKRERGMEFAMENLRKLTYKGTPYETSPLGTEEEVTEITREDLIRRLKEIRRAGSMILAVAGDMPFEEALPLIEKYLSDIEAGSYTFKTESKSIKESVVKRVKREGTQATILCAFNAPDRLSEDYFTFKVLASALGDGMTSKLFRVLREEKGYAYATYAFYPTRLSSPRLFAYVGTSPEKRDSALKDLLKVVKEEDISEEEVKIAKRKIVGDFLLDHQTRLRQAWYLGFFEILGLGWETDERYPTKIEEVSHEDVKRAVRRFIDKHHCVVVEPE